VVSSSRLNTLKAETTIKGDFYGSLDAGSRPLADNAPHRDASSRRATGRPQCACSAWI
jgi:hypothetical protein